MDLKSRIYDFLQNRPKIGPKTAIGILVGFLGLGAYFIDLPCVQAAPKGVKQAKSEDKESPSKVINDAIKNGPFSKEDENAFQRLYRRTKEFLGGVKGKNLPDFFKRIYPNLPEESILEKQYLLIYGLNVNAGGSIEKDISNSLYLNMPINKAYPHLIDLRLALKHRDSEIDQKTLFADDLKGVEYSGLVDVVLHQFGPEEDLYAILGFTSADAEHKLRGGEYSNKLRASKQGAKLGLGTEDGPKITLFGFREKESQRNFHAYKPVETTNFSETSETSLADTYTEPFHEEDETILPNGNKVKTIIDGTTTVEITQGKQKVAAVGTSTRNSDIVREVREKAEEEGFRLEGEFPVDEESRLELFIGLLAKETTKKIREIETTYTVKDGTVTSTVTEPVKANITQTGEMTTIVEDINGNEVSRTTTPINNSETGKTINIANTTEDINERSEAETLYSLLHEKDREHWTKVGGAIVSDDLGLGWDVSKCFGHYLAFTLGADIRRLGSHVGDHNIKPFTALYNAHRIEQGIFAISAEAGFDVLKPDSLEGEIGYVFRFGAKEKPDPDNKELRQIARAVVREAETKRANKKDPRLTRPQRKELDGVAEVGAYLAFPAKTAMIRLKADTEEEVLPCYIFELMYKPSKNVVVGGKAGLDKTYVNAHAYFKIGKNAHLQIGGGYGVGDGLPGTMYRDGSLARYGENARGMNASVNLILILGKKEDKWSKK